jgi:hypothetical protein
VRRALAACVALYVPHLTEEAMTRMHDDPLIVSAFEPVSDLSARHAAYLVFQIMLVMALGMTLLFSLGGKPRLAVMACLGVAMILEGHHALRAIGSLAYDPGLVTSLPMPFAGALVLARLARGPRSSLRLSPEPS